MREAEVGNWNSESPANVDQAIADFRLPTSDFKCEFVRLYD